MIFVINYKKLCQQGLLNGTAEPGGFSRANFSSLKKVDCKVFQLLFYVRLVNECQIREGETLR